MPLRHEPLLADLDLDTRVMLSEVYLEACRALDTPSKTVKQLDELRTELGDRIVRLALAGERDPSVIKRTALEAVRGVSLS